MSDPDGKPVVLDDGATWLALGGKRNGLLVVLLGGDSDHASQIVAEGSHVALPRPLGREGDRGIQLPRLSRRAFQGGLEAMGFEDNAYTVATETGRSLSALRRQLGADVRVAWAEPDRGRDLVPALVAGGWDESQTGDRKILASLAATSSFSNLAISRSSIPVQRLQESRCISI